MLDLPMFLLYFLKVKISEDEESSGLGKCIWIYMDDDGMEIHAFGASGCSIQDPTKNNAIHVYHWCKAPDGRSFFAVYLQSALEVWLPVKQMDFFV